jgi:S-adenosylmethionine synthetase
MGLERTIVTLNGLKNVYETDAFAPVLGRIRDIVGADRYVERSGRIIADHLRAATHMIADGVTPKNVDQGYILRRLIRRAIRECYKMGYEAPIAATQHAEKTKQEDIRAALIKDLFKPTLGKHWKDDIEILVNPTGRFVQGGFEADAGLTGRKIMVDTYGGLMPHGGGAFSGKDATKVDRSAAYMCRFVAKNLVANGYAKKALVTVAYAIGRVDPVMVEAFDMDGGQKGKDLTEIVNKHFDFRPAAIIERLELRKPIFRATAAYGHFGVDGRPWEKIVKI